LLVQALTIKKVTVLLPVRTQECASPLRVPMVARPVRTVAERLQRLELQLPR
jgi:hypothetical protein